VYVGWPYVMLKGGPGHALNARRNIDVTPWHSALPELVFPSDRSWLVSTLWDDDWRCVGGPAALVGALLLHPNLRVRTVGLDEDATPPRPCKLVTHRQPGRLNGRSATGTLRTVPGRPRVGVAMRVRRVRRALQRPAVAVWVLEADEATPLLSSTPGAGTPPSRSSASAA